MRETSWMITSLILLMLRKASCWLPHDRSFMRSSCIDLVARHHFRSDSSVAVLTTDLCDFQPTTWYSLYPGVSEDSLTHLLSSSTQFSLVTMKATENTSCCSDRVSSHSAVDYLILVGSSNNVIRCIQTFCFNKITNDRTSFVVYLETEEIDAADTVENTLKTFWKHQQQNVAILVQSEPEVIDIYTWFPLDVTPKVKIADQCYGKSFRENTSLFPLKLPHDLNGKVINIGLVVAPIGTCERIGGGFAGFEVELIEAMASALNFTAVYHLSSTLVRENDSQLDYWEGSSDPWKTVLLRMLSGEVNIGIGGFILWSKLFNDFDYTYPFAGDKYRFYVTNDMILTGETGRWIGIMTLQMIIVHIFTTLVMRQLRQRDLGRNENYGRTAITVRFITLYNSTMMIIIALRIFSVQPNVFSWVRRTPEMSNGVSQSEAAAVIVLQYPELTPIANWLPQTVNTVWAVLTDLPDKVSDLSTRQRLLWVLLFYYSLNINAAYKSLVTSLLASPKYTERIQTVRDLIDSGLPVIVSSGLPKNVISGAVSRDQYKKLRKRLSSCTYPIHKCLPNLKSVPKYCVAAFTQDMNYVKYALPNHKLHRLQRTIRTSYLGIYTAKNFFLTRKMTMMILRSSQAGLMDLWTDSALNSKNVCELHDPDRTLLYNAEANRPEPEDYSNDLVSPLAMKNLYSAFTLLGLGLLVAGLVCVFEILSATPACRSLWTRLKRFCGGLRDRQTHSTFPMSLLQ